MAMRPYFIILLCLTPDDFTCQGESAVSQWVNQHSVNPLSSAAPFIILFCLTPDNFTLSNLKFKANFPRYCL
jgi:hypothetical protein